MNKLLITDGLNHRLEQLLAAAERGDAESCEYRARILEALARGIKAYYSALSILGTSHLSPTAGVSPSFSPAVNLSTAEQGDTPAAGSAPAAGDFLLEVKP